MKERVKIVNRAVKESQCLKSPFVKIKQTIITKVAKLVLKMVQLNSTLTFKVVIQIVTPLCMSA